MQAICVQGSNERVIVDDIDVGDLLVRIQNVTELRGRVGTDTH